MNKLTRKQQANLYIRAYRALTAKEGLPEIPPDVLRRLYPLAFTVLFDALRDGPPETLAPMPLGYGTFRFGHPVCAISKRTARHRLRYRYGRKTYKTCKQGG